jgi:transcriptional accessory protein Tex/SPT6
MAGQWWVPILVAVVGLVGGVGGALAGGKISNEGQEQQFDSQRTAEIQDLLIATYARYLRDATTVWVFVANEDPKLEDPHTKQLAAEAFASETEVEFEAASEAVDDAAQQLYNAATEAPDTFEETRQDFIDAAGTSLDG